MITDEGMKQLNDIFLYTARIASLNIKKSTATGRGKFRIIKWVDLTS